MSDIQYGLTLLVFGGGLTLASLGVLVLVIYIVIFFQGKAQKDG